MVDAGDPAHVEAAAAFAADAVARGHEGVVVEVRRGDVRHGAARCRLGQGQAGAHARPRRPGRGAGQRPPQRMAQQPAPRRAGPDGTLRRAGRLRDAGQDVQGADRRDAALADAGAAAARRRARPTATSCGCAPRSWSRSPSTGCRPRRATPPGWPCGSPGSCATGPTSAPRRPTRSRRCRRCTRHDVGVGVGSQGLRGAGSGQPPTAGAARVEAWVRDRCPRTAEGARHGRDL